jgi:hypothetical protein
MAVPPRLLLTGPPRVGKSTAIGRLVRLLQERRLPVGGFVTDERREYGKRAGFVIRDLTGPETVLAYQDYAAGVRAEAVAQTGARLAVHPRVRQVQFRDDTGVWNTDPAYPDGLYLGLGYRSPQGRDWTLDIWFVDEPERQPDLTHLQAIPPRLTPDLRAAILQIKDAWADSPEYGRSVRSYDVYRSVLDDGVRTPEQFEEWRTRTTTH